MRKYKDVYLKNILQWNNYKTASEKENFSVFCENYLILKNNLQIFE